MNRVFGIYADAQQAEAAVDLLISAGIPGSAISVLHPDNESSRAFAKRKSTRPPEGTAYGETASRPLGGEHGFSDPAGGPKPGALPIALVQMGVPAEWCAGRVLEGKLLLSAETGNTGQQACAEGILQYTRAEDIATVTADDTSAPITAHDGLDLGARNIPDAAKRS